MDWNNDGRLDLVVGESGILDRPPYTDWGYVRVYLNVGSRQSPRFDGYSYIKVNGQPYNTGYCSGPVVVDWDNDGRKDLLVSERTGKIHLLLNSGTDAEPAFSFGLLVQSGGSAIQFTEIGGVAVVDWNRDGKKDLIVGGKPIGVASYGLAFFQNTGTDANPSFNGYTLLSAGGKPIALDFPRVVATDWNGDGLSDLVTGENRAMRCFRAFEPGQPAVDLLSYRIQDLDGDGHVAPGEPVQLVLCLDNVGTSVTGVQVVLTTTNPVCTVVRGTWDVGVIASGAVVSNAASPFLIVPTSNALLGTQMVLDLTVTGEAGAYIRRSHLNVRVSQPIPIIAGVYVDDHEGNTNGLVEPGERACVYLALTNSGLRGEGVTAVLEPVGSYLSVMSSNISFGEVAPNSRPVKGQLPGWIEIASTAATGVLHSVQVRIKYTNAVNEDLLLVPLSEYTNSSATFDWLDTTHGTVLTFPEWDYEEVEIGFQFPFYERRYERVYVTQFGYLSLHSPYAYGMGSALSGHSTIPDDRGPYGLISPFGGWSWTGDGRVIRHATGGVAPNRYWVVEWNSIKPSGVATQTFQVVLYEDGTIRFQYLLASDSSSQTIGIEAPEATRGCLYAYNQADSVTNRMAIVFRPVRASDGDGDGILDSFERFFFGHLERCGDEDSDHDGLTNREEQRCGTDPDDSGSVLSLIGMESQGPEGITVQWSSVPGRRYMVETCTNLMDGTWTATNILPICAGVGGTNAHLWPVAPQNTPCFVRIRLSE